MQQITFSVAPFDCTVNATQGKSVWNAGDHNLELLAFLVVLPVGVEFQDIGVFGDIYTGKDCIVPFLMCKAQILVTLQNFCSQLGFCETVIFCRQIESLYQAFLSHEIVDSSL